MKGTRAQQQHKLTDVTAQSGVAANNAASGTTRLRLPVGDVRRCSSSTSPLVFRHHVITMQLRLLLLMMLFAGLLRRRKWRLVVWLMIVTQRVDRRRAARLVCWRLRQATVAGITPNQGFRLARALGSRPGVLQLLSTETFLLTLNWRSCTRPEMSLYASAPDHYCHFISLKPLKDSWQTALQQIPLNPHRKQERCKFNLRNNKLGVGSDCTQILQCNVNTKMEIR